MKLALAIFSLSLLAAPALAVADDAPPAGAAAVTPPNAAQRQAMFQTMERFRAQHETLRQQARAAMLGALTPAHRAELANVVGGLAVAATPDAAAAARRLDGLLSSNEQQSILRAESSLVTQERALHEQMRAQFESQLSTEQRANVAFHGAHIMGGGPIGQHQAPASDAGSVLLRATSVHFEPVFFGGPHGM